MSAAGERPEDAEPAAEPEPGSDAAGPASDDEAGDDVVPPEPEPEPEWKRRRRLAQMFGDDRHATGKGDDWYRDQVPPHHG